MNYFFLLFFLCGVQTGFSQINALNSTETVNATKSVNTTEIKSNASESFGNRFMRLMRRRQRVPIVLASIRDSNSGLPKCTGVFVSPSTLMTTARCLFCDRDCNLTVYVNDPREGKVMNYKIKSVKLHEDFEMNPQRKDIGIVELDGKVRESAVMELSDGRVNPTKLRAYSFVGRFRNGEYYFVARRVHVISNAKCTYTLHNYVPESRVCAYTDRRYYLKEQDQGSPLVYLSDNKFYVLGTFVTDNFEFEIGAKIAVYQRISSYMKWVDKYGRNKTDDELCPSLKSTTPEDISIYFGKIGKSNLTETIIGGSNSTVAVEYGNTTLQGPVKNAEITTPETIKVTDTFAAETTVSL